VTAQQLITQALQIAGNTGLAPSDALNELNNALQGEYRRKYRNQRKTVTLNLGAGTPVDTVDWDATFLGLYQQQDGSVGRYVIPGGAAPGYIAKMWALDYRQYIAKADRLSASGPPRYVVGDDIGATWYVWPVPDQSYTVTVDIYALPALLALGDSPPAWLPDELLVQIVKVWAFEWMQDDRFTLEKKMLFGDAKSEIPGMLPTFRRRQAATEGTVFQTALDQRVFAPMGGWSDDRGDVWN